MTAHAHLAASVPVYRLRFQRSFAVAGACSTPSISTQPQS